MLTFICKACLYSTVTYSQVVWNSNCLQQNKFVKDDCRTVLTRYWWMMIIDTRIYLTHSSGGSIGGNYIQTPSASHHCIKNRCAYCYQFMVSTCGFERSWAVNKSCERRIEDSWNESATSDTESPIGTGQPRKQRSEYCKKSVLRRKKNLLATVFWICNDRKWRLLGKGDHERHTIPGKRRREDPKHLGTRTWRHGQGL